MQSCHMIYLLGKVTACLFSVNYPLCIQSHNWNNEMYNYLEELLRSSNKVTGDKLSCGSINGSDGYEVGAQ